MPPESRLFLTKRDLTVQVLSFFIGLASSASASRAAIIICSVGFLYLLVILVLPMIHPGIILADTQNQISSTRLWLVEEAATRRSAEIYAISYKGLISLESVEQRVKSLLFQHLQGCTLFGVFRYALILLKLLTNARKCRLDLISLRSDLEDEVNRLHDSVYINSNTRQSRQRRNAGRMLEIV